jgi:hypothetical protein
MQCASKNQLSQNRETLIKCASHKSTTMSPLGCEQHTRTLPSAGFSSGAGR